MRLLKADEFAEQRGIEANRVEELFRVGAIDGSRREITTCLAPALADGLQTLLKDYQEASRA
jgi:hypothetical protein